MNTANLLKNSLWNFLGQLLPLGVAVISIPILIKGIGTDRFGILTLSWMITGYFSLFDFGLGRALTQLVSEKIAKNQASEVPDIIQTVLALMIGFGVIAALILAASSQFIVGNLIKVPDELKTEAIQSSWIIAATIPLVIGTTALKGALEAIHRFDLVNLIRSPLGILSYLIPVLILPFSKSLTATMLCFFIVRILGYLIHLFYCKKLFPDLRLIQPIKFELFKPLFGFGSWMTVSNVIGPIMVQMDRFYIGSVVSLTAVTYYSTPYEMVNKLWILPVSLSSVLFPTLSKALVTDRILAGKLYSRSCIYLFFIMVPILLIAILFAKEILSIWISVDFALQSYQVLQILAFGILFNSVASVPFTTVQSAGRPDITAKLHLFELPIYLFLIWSLTAKFGIVGSAVAWTARVALDGILLAFCTEKYVFKRSNEMPTIKALILALTLLGSFFLLVWSSAALTWQIRILEGTLLLCLLSWIASRSLHHDDRQKLINYWNKLTRSN